MQFLYFDFDSEYQNYLKNYISSNVISALLTDIIYMNTRSYGLSEVLKLNKWSIKADILLSPLFKTLNLPPYKWRDEKTCIILIDVRLLAVELSLLRRGLCCGMK
jgi:hypothetical protein